MNQELVEMDGGAFAEWAAERFGLDYDDVRFLDMQRDLDAPARGLLAEQPTGATIPSELRDILIARKAARVTIPRPPFKPTEKPSEWELRDGTPE